jgi:hypothetical protein
MRSFNKFGNEMTAARQRHVGELKAQDINRRTTSRGNVGLKAATTRRLHVTAVRRLGVGFAP